MKVLVEEKLRCEESKEFQNAATNRRPFSPRYFCLRRHNTISTPPVLLLTFHVRKKVNEKEKEKEKDLRTALFESARVSPFET
jgi:hypothetical protein